MDYDIFSRYYDALTRDVDYASRAEYLAGLFIKYDKMPSLLLDVGCGTGGFSVEFAKKGVEVIGADPSYGMLTAAGEKARKHGVNILFLNQSGQELDLYGTVDGVISCLDTVNHITDKRSLQSFFNRISLFLEPSRLFIFDVNTLYKQKEVLGDNTFVFDTDEVYCVWQNSFDKKAGVTDIFLDFFEKNNNGYLRSCEEFSERVYSREELEAMLNKAGFKLITVLDDGKKTAPSKTSQRNIYVARKGV
ncbi:MAG: class I SAM-dependent methyltransferase [Clostridia bacterium]|nr:class I SAM-dependent methyltransferase [Clostridia bacterium]